MRKHVVILTLLFMLFAGGWLLSEDTEPESVKSQFDTAVEVIKKYEGLHKASHWPLVGYGHKVLPTDKFKRGKALSEAEADKLLRADLTKLCAMYRSFGKDSLLLATLAYNLGHGAVNKSTVYKKLKAGDRDIKENYLSHCRYRGKVLSQLQRRRAEEFERLFIAEETVEKEIIHPVNEEQEHETHREARNNVRILEYSGRSLAVNTTKRL